MFFKKDILLFWRDKKNILFLIAAPFIMILILGFSMRGMMETSTAIEQIRAAVVIEDQEVEGRE
ncbi:hypothetical protein [Bacillus horti]|uniref:ABC-type Na+ efflux pump permease subunit n=1 Tax=Caldalkalibacillus horti TaxID=77523 RepID=A0ABT9VUQ4_9BACI|nr:hypothetical protein [Bacillus horti]MDQ0164723.1 ABC-type Na+ efflux pump permease subunit [Bacillus horti]